MSKGRSTPRQISPAALRPKHGPHPLPKRPPAPRFAPPPPPGMPHRHPLDEALGLEPKENQEKRS